MSDIGGKEASRAVKLLRAFKTELDPNNVQRTLMLKSAGAARFAWNWGLARRIAEYKANAQGSVLMRAPRFFASSKTCSGCGQVKDKIGLDERTYVCGSCGLTLDRDLNAARNLAQLPQVLREETPGKSTRCKAARRTRKEPRLLRKE